MGSKSMAICFILFNLALFAFMSTDAATSCFTDDAGVCLDLLHQLVELKAGRQPNAPCCKLIGGLVGFDAAVCLCNNFKNGAISSAITAVGLPLSVKTILNNCGQPVPADFVCSK